MILSRALQTEVKNRLQPVKWTIWWTIPLLRRKRGGAFSGGGSEVVTRATPSPAVGLAPET